MDAAGLTILLRELKGFRRLVRHAYDLTLRPDRLAELVAIADQVTTGLPQWCTEFERKVKLEQGWGDRTS